MKVLTFHVAANVVARRFVEKAVDLATHVPWVADGSFDGGTAHILQLPAGGAHKT